MLFHDNHNGTAYLAGIPLPNTVGTYHLTITATNSVGYTTQSFTLIIKKASVIALPTNLPPSNGALGGVPTHSVQGQLLHLSGSGFAAGAPITIGYYPGAKTLTHTIAGPTGIFAVDIRTNVLGNHTFVAGGIGSNGQTRWVEAASNTVHASSSSGHWPSGGGIDAASGSLGGLPLADTGPSGDLRRTAGFALAALLAGLGLLLIGRRRLIG